MPNFILTFNTFMGLKIFVFRVMKEKTHFWTDILDFGGCHLGILQGMQYFQKQWGLQSVCTNFHACITFLSQSNDLRINLTNVLLSSICESTYMMYLKSRRRYRHVLGTKPSVMANFVLTFNTFMGCKINAFQVMKLLQHFIRYKGQKPVFSYFSETAITHFCIPGCHTNVMIPHMSCPF